MTTIAYDGRYIACDSRESMGHIILSDKVEKFVATPEAVYFGAGVPCDIDRLIEVSDQVVHEYHLEATILVAEEDGVFTVSQSEEGGVYKNSASHLDSYAIGSGTEFAMSAMDFGMNAKEAVEYAMTRDLYTGGKVTVFDTTLFEFVSDAVEAE